MPLPTVVLAVQTYNQSNADMISINISSSSLACINTPQWRHNEREPFVLAQIKENVKAPRHGPLLGEFTGNWWISRTKGQ